MTQPTELQLWHLDQEINDLGIYVDRNAARACVELRDKVTRELNKRVRELTGGVVKYATQAAEILNWTNVQLGGGVDSLAKGPLAALLARDDLPPLVREVLEIRQQVGQTATAKYQKLLDATSDEDPRLRGTLQFCGASRTGRWAGRLFQPQNLPRPDKAVGDISVCMDAIVGGTFELLY